MIRINIFIAVIVATVTYGFWAVMNRPEVEPMWPSIIQGFSFSPMGLHHDPTTGKLPTVEEIEKDVALLAGKTHSIRTYTVDGTLSQIPVLARKHGLNVALGAWLDARLEQNAIEIENLISLAEQNRKNVVRVIVGNEVILRNDISIESLSRHLDHVRAEVGMPVSTAEPWHVWIKHPELAQHVDYLAVHMLPYWEGVPNEIAVDYIVERMDQLKLLFPDKPIVIAEVGWPSNGRTLKSSIADKAWQAIFLRRFLHRAEQEKYTYYVMEAFDQPWKRVSEGAVGAYWGVYDAERNAKFEFVKPIVGLPQWQMLAIMSVIIAAIVFALLLSDANTLNRRGRSFLALVAYLLTTVVVWIAYDYSQQYMTVGAIIVGVLMMLGMIGVIIVLLIEAHEWAEALWVKGRRRELKAIVVAEADLPMVSIHVPAYNEPPDMLIKTLDALAALDYPRYEVIVIDNNTKDAERWQPVEKHCAGLGKKFRFFHKDPLPGFKAGALNFALRETAPEATIVAVIDSDYCVVPTWLRELVSQFVEPEVAIVQAPQDYRDSSDSLFKTICFAEYRGFFHIGMVTRNERNAIIQHGTMTMVRRSCLEEVGGWSERTITEDAELGLMIFSAGYQAVYTPKSYGKGLMPDSFLDYKNQRFRWAYGAMQILRHHASELRGKVNNKLTLGQRYHFVAGWLPWIADGINLIFNFAALAWSVAMIVVPNKIDPPLVIFSILPLSLFIFKIAKVIYLYHGVHIVSSARETVAAAFSGLALSHTIAKAMWSGLFTDGRPFLRTPKMEQSVALFKAIGTASEETLMTTALWLAAGVIYYQLSIDTWDILLWVMVLLVQSLPYFSAVCLSIISALPKGKTEPVASSLLPEE
ncbi:MAG: glycosyltransferase [Proteobacteria bacterium]|nr:glycosyltransferase [Pseudomonadota bacterium]MBU1060110.1 glycosyltransferase [Pseudomonadota bacterium]